MKNIVGSLYPLVLHPWIQPIVDGKYSGKKNSRKFQQAKL